jgi:peptide/nickel transport system ATP-binding protein
MPVSLLEIKGLEVQYRTDDDLIFAVNGIDLSLEKGKTLGLVGETGAGKTTVALSIMRLLPERVGEITAGSILLDGVNLLRQGDSEMRSIRGNKISMIFQDPMTSLNPTLTVGEQIAEVIVFHRRGCSKQQMQDRVDELMQLVGLPKERQGEYPHQFSGGMKQRVVIAMALACDPQLILADEPTTALDVTIQAQVLNMMQELRERFETAMILITHDLGVVAEVCDDVAIVYAGEILELGAVEDIFEAERHHPYTAGLFGSIPDLTKEEPRLHPIDGLMPDPTIKLRGCVFYDRCPRKMNRCAEKKPSTVELSPSHFVKCCCFEPVDVKRGQRDGHGFA